MSRNLTFDRAGNIVEVVNLPDDPAEINEAVVASKLEQRLADLQTIIDRPQTTLADNTVGAIRAAIRDVQTEVKTLARVDRLQTRKLIRLLDGTD